jgi:hypothetical protein
MANANTSSALRLWIDPIIKMSKPGEHQAGRSLRDNGTTEDWIGGVIEHIAAVSAGLCMAFEAAEVEKERLAASPKEPLSDDPLEAINAPDIGFELGTETQDKIQAELRIVIGKKAQGSYPLARLSQSRGHFLRGRAVNIGRNAFICLDEINSTCEGGELCGCGTAPRLGGSALGAWMPVWNAVWQLIKPLALLTWRLRDGWPACSGAVSLDTRILSSIQETVLSPMFTIPCRGKYTSLCESRA